VKILIRPQMLRSATQTNYNPAARALPFLIADFGGWPTLSKF